MKSGEVIFSLIGLKQRRLMRSSLTGVSVEATCRQNFAPSQQIFILDTHLRHSKTVFSCDGQPKFDP